MPTKPPAPVDIRKMILGLLGQWTPHPLSQQEVNNIRAQCQMTLRATRDLESLERSHGKLPIHQQWERFRAKIQYMVLYWRIFRFHDLPPEIITNIMRFVAWSAPNPQDGTLQRLRLTWTCRSWRTIALADSTLWNAIWFRDSYPHSRSFAWFDRARTAPLDIRINDSAHSPFTLEHMQELVSRLFTKISTIRMIIIICEDWLPALAVLDLLQKAGSTGLPMILERFELHRGIRNTTFEWPGDFEPKPFLNGINVPSLRYLSLNGISVDWSTSNFTNLTTFDLRRLPLPFSPTPSRFRQILMNCPGLQKLSLDGAGPLLPPEPSPNDPMNEDVPEPVFLPRLRTLVIADLNIQYCSHVVSTFTAPNLRDLTLMNLVGEDYSPFLTQLTAAYPKVKLLTVYSVQVRQDNVGEAVTRQWLDSMPDLCYLRIANTYRSFMAAFFRPPPAPTGKPSSPSSPASTRAINPKLDVIDVQHIDPQLIVMWANLRAKMGVPLRKLYASKEMLEKLDPEHRDELIALGCKLFVLPPGATTVEEDEISGMTDSE